MMDHRQPHEILADRVISIAERGRVFVTTLDEGIGWFATDHREGVVGVRVGPHLTEYSAKIELALRVLDAEFDNG